MEDQVLLKQQYTACILGGINLIPASASDEKVLKLGAFLGIAMGFLMGMSAIEFIYPSAGKSNLFQNINIYGGLLIFGLQTAYLTYMLNLYPFWYDHLYQDQFDMVLVS